MPLISVAEGGYWDTLVKGWCKLHETMREGEEEEDDGPAAPDTYLDLYCHNWYSDRGTVEPFFSRALEAVRKWLRAKEAHEAHDDREQELEGTSTNNKEIFQPSQP